MSADPYISTTAMTNPSGWNRYAYVEGDPINFNDPSGLFRLASPEHSFPPSTGHVPTEHLISQLQPHERVHRGPTLTNVERLEEAGLSESCAKGLSGARKSIDSLRRAKDAAPLLRAAAQSTGIDWRMLAAIGVRESGFRNIDERKQDGTIGYGRGVFQIDIGENPNVAENDARNLEWAANWAAKYLAGNLAQLRSKFPAFNQEQLLQATAASYNFGLANISGNPATIDKGSTWDNYGFSVVHLMDCF